MYPRARPDDASSIKGVSFPKLPLPLFFWLNYIIALPSRCERRTAEPRATTAPRVPVPSPQRARAL